MEQHNLLQKDQATGCAIPRFARTFFLDASYPNKSDVE
jgi:hypothetical protein